MTWNITEEEAYARGQAAAEGALNGTLQKSTRDNITWARSGYLGLEGVDLEREVLAFSRERMAADLDLTKFPECRGLRERIEAERRGFADRIDNPTLAAFHFDWFWFCSRRLNTRFVARRPPPSQCTAIWFADTREGGVVCANNLDDILLRATPGFASPPGTGPADREFTGVSLIAGVSSAVLCDDEPENLFPVPMEWIWPRDLTDLGESMTFIERYQDFWGPGNQIYCDADLNFAAVEKANVRMGVRYSIGWSAITACSYLTPEMNAFKRERNQRSFEARGWGPDNTDARYWDGCESRYRRLLDLCKEEHRRGATVIGAAQIVLDHAVPFPERICLAGETGDPNDTVGDPENVMANWTLTSSAQCVTGPNRRMLYWCLEPEDLRPIYHTACHVIPGEGIEERKAEWEAEVAAAGEIGLHP